MAPGNMPSPVLSTQSSVNLGLPMCQLHLAGMIETSIDCLLIFLCYFGGQTPKLLSASHPHVILEQCVFQFDLLAIYWMSPQH
jgi:hypothetical protein